MRRGNDARPSGRTNHFSPGQSVVWRSVWADIQVVGTAWPGTVVIDSDDLVALYRPIGTVGKQRTGVRGGPRGRMLVEWDGGYGDLVWHSVNVLILARPGDPYSVWRAWGADSWELAWRYVNLELPWQRTPIGFDSKDLYLDLWSDAAGAEWRYKDEDEAAFAVEQGKITAEQLAAARGAGAQAVEQIRRREPPHDRDWDGWRPDPTWETPALPDDWRSFKGSPRQRRTG